MHDNKNRKRLVFVRKDSNCCENNQMHIEVYFNGETEKSNIYYDCFPNEAKTVEELINKLNSEYAKLSAFENTLLEKDKENKIKEEALINKINQYKADKEKLEQEKNQCNIREHLCTKREQECTEREQECTEREQECTKREQKCDERESNIRDAQKAIERKNTEIDYREKNAENGFPLQRSKRDKCVETVTDLFQNIFPELGEIREQIRQMQSYAQEDDAHRMNNLCMFCRELSLSSEKDIREISYKLGAILQRDFGLSVIEPENGTQFNAIEYERCDLSKRGDIVTGCKLIGWKYKDEVVLRAVVLTDD